MDFLSPIFHQRQRKSAPFVTLTFAESSDGKIAGKNGQQLILSGTESMIMTHWMRTMHDAILIGIGTALNDDPQLNTRHLPARDPDPANSEHQNPYHLPRPVILDSKLRARPECKLLNNYQQGRGRRPWILCDDSVPEVQTRRLALENAGAVVIPIPCAESGRLSITSVLRILQQRGVNSVMVEGGASVIQSFLADPHLVDTLIVTTAPKVVGPDGISHGVVLNHIGDFSSFKHVASQQFGDDTVVAWNAIV